MGYMEHLSVKTCESLHQPIARRERNGALSSAQVVHMYYEWLNWRLNYRNTSIECLS